MEEATGGMKNERHPGVGHVDVETEAQGNDGPACCLCPPRLTIRSQLIRLDEVAHRTAAARVCVGAGSSAGHRGVRPALSVVLLLCWPRLFGHVATGVGQVQTDGRLTSD